MQRFVAATTNIDTHFLPDSRLTPHSSHDQIECGKLVKEFYEEVVGTGSIKGDTTCSDIDVTQSTQDMVNNINKKHTQKEKCHRAKPNSSSGDGSLPFTRCVSKLFYAAQHGLVAELSDCISSGVKVNVTDDYLWTPLMCASHAGHYAVVRILLEHGADGGKVNNMGQTALQLARSMHRTEIVKLLTSEPPQETNADNPDVVEDTSSRYYCDTCCMEVTHGVAGHEHERSVVHMLSGDRSTASTNAYGIPPCNRGYQMMLRTGWDNHRGLGSHQQGRKYPVKTRLKLDREGLGNKSKDSAKVTHVFKKVTTEDRGTDRSRDNRAPSTRTVNRYKKTSKADREKEWEKNLRRYMNE